MAQQFSAVTINDQQSNLHNTRNYKRNSKKYKKLQAIEPLSIDLLGNFFIIYLQDKGNFEKNYLWIILNWTTYWEGIEKIYK